MKKKYFLRLSILSCLLLFVLSGYTFASWSVGEFEEKVTQVYKIKTTYYSNNYSTMFSNFINSNIYLQYKDTIPFDNYDNLFCLYNGTYFIIWLFNGDTTFYVNNNGRLKVNNDLIDIYGIGFTVDTRYWTFGLRDNYGPYLNYLTTYDYLLVGSYAGVGSGVYDILAFTNNTITNQYNYTIYGYNMTANMPVYNGTTYVDNGEYYKLSSGFVGSYYYDNDNYQNLEYKIISNQSEEYIGLKNIYYTPDTNGQKVDLYVYVSPDMSQKGYKVVLYYNEEVLYQENAYNTLIVNGGGSSGDSGGGGGGSVDLTETNNLIAGLGNIIKSGDDKIANTIKSGDDRLYNAITSGDNKIVSTLTDDSEVDNILGSIYTSGDDINDLVDMLGYTPFENQFQSVIFSFINGLCDVLTTREDLYWDVTIGNTTQRIYTTDFDMLPTALKVFVSSYLVFACLYVLYNSLRKTIDLLSMANTKTVLDTIEVDVNYIKM